jgi:Ca-activated chloride channel family protein
MSEKKKLSTKRTGLLLLLVLLSSLAPVNIAGQSKRPRWATRDPKAVEAQPEQNPRRSASPSPPGPPASTSHRASGQNEGEAVELSAHLVVVPVSVTDAQGKPVPDLKAEDFLLEEEGKPQQIISLGEPGKTPIELALLFDVSGSVYARFPFMQQSALRFLREVLKPNDAVSVYSIGLHPKLVQPRTTSVEEAIAGVMTIEPTKEATAFFDAVAEAAHQLGRVADPNRRRVLVVISDGEDNHSDRHTLSDALQELQRSDCLFYSINPGWPAIRLNKISLKGQEGMEGLATQTGGAIFLPETLENVETAFRQIAAELQTQYLFGYYPAVERADGQFVRVSVRVPNRPELRVHARQGYYALKF